MFIKLKRNVTGTQKTNDTCLLQFGLCLTHKDAACNLPFTAPGAKFDLHKQNFLAAVGRLRLFDAKLIDAAIRAGIHFDLSNIDPARIMVKPGKEYGDTFFELLRSVEPSLSILGPKILAAIEPESIDALLDEQITV